MENFVLNTLLPKFQNSFPDVDIHSEYGMNLFFTFFQKEVYNCLYEMIGDTTPYCLEIVTILKTFVEN